VRRIRTLDAIICASDLFAIGAMRGLADLGVGVGTDIAIVGWDDTVDGRYCSPTLSTVSPDLEFLADATLDALIRRIEGDRGPGRTVVVPHQLIIRDSSEGVR